MRVGLLVYGSLETISGGYLYDRKLVDHLRRHGDEVSVVSLAWRNYARHLGDNLSPSLLNRLVHLPVDILLQDELNHPSLFRLNRRLRARVSYPIISIVHHLHSNEARPAWQNTIYRWIENRYLSTVDGFVFNSQTTRSTVESLVGAGRPSVVAYPAADRLCPDITDEQIAERARQSGPFRIIFLGNVIPRKGLHTLLDALEQLPENNWTLTVVGSLQVDKAYAWAMRRRAARPDLAERVLFLGPVPDAVLIDKLGESHLLVVPSSYEGFGIVYLEGMGFGLPAIASTAGGSREIVTPGEDGFLVSPGDSTTLAQRLRELNEDRERLLTMSLNARRHYVSHLTWQKTAKHIRAFLQTVAERSSDA
ncbi:MAG: glycosyltransferase family 4 protein [Chloroflexota bacterium]